MCNDDIRNYNRKIVEFGGLGYLTQVKLIRHLNYSERLRRLNLPTLRYRRHRGDMIEIFKILHKIYDAEITEGLLQLSFNTTTRGHSLKQKFT